MSQRRSLGRHSQKEDSYLKNYAYRIPISPMVFVFALGAAMVITILTVSFQAVRAAVANPADALKYE